jgi:AcrR family transcriptional regulator
MPSQDPEQSGKVRIVKATIQLLHEKGAAATTTDRVAAAAGCAKGLVHYHFGTKSALWTAVIGTLAERRRNRWSKAFTGRKWAVTDTWKIVLEDREDGIVKLIASIIGQDRETDDAISQTTQQFGHTMTDAVRRFLERMDMEPGVPIEQLGWSLSSVLYGTIVQLDAGAPAEILADAWAAAWLGVLSSGNPRPPQRPRRKRRR